ncbi:MAG: multicomponent Na+:H+ antiporter subunit [Candidatus Atribacteria bacterium]|nr:multicomponent Na+:H+ antiporter subunit [Candidatus Atribacteria bacterium]
MIEIKIVIAYLLMAMGVLFALTTVIGLFRFPDLYTRIHASTVSSTMSALCATAGLAIYLWDPLLSSKIILIGVLLFISNPMATHAIARASYRKKITLPTTNSPEERKGDFD